jgi:hypothetical protein
MFCTRCGANNLDVDQFCRSCSSPLVKPGSAQQGKPVSSGSPQQPYPYSSPYPSPGQDQQQPPPQGYGQYPGYQGYSQPQYGYPNQSYPQQASASGRAIAAMIMSIVSPFTCGAFLSIPAMILGKMEMNAIRQGQAPPAGETFAKVGFYVGLVVTILSCLAGLLYAILFIGSASNSFQ